MTLSSEITYSTVAFDKSTFFPLDISALTSKSTDKSNGNSFTLVFRFTFFITESDSSLISET